MKRVVRYFRLLKFFNNYNEGDDKISLDIDGITYEVRTLKTGDAFFSYGSGKELVRLDTNKSVMRKYRFTTNLDDSSCYWQEDNRTFWKNI